MCRSFQNLTVETAIKSVDFDEVTRKNKLALFVAHGVSAIVGCDERETSIPHRVQGYNAAQKSINRVAK